MTISGRRASEGTRTGFAGFIVGGGVLAGLQVLQQVLGAFEPREVVTVLIAVAVALATTAAAKWRARAQRDAKLEHELRAWPLPLLRDVDPLLLGVWPERATGGLAQYVEREVDDRLRPALVTSGFVLVWGPPRAGKSRTAAAMAQQALGDTPVIVPRGPSAFDALLDPDLRLDVGSEGVVLWLDGLERYVDAVDATRLDELAAICDLTKTVATIRTEDWDALLDASDQRGEAAKAIAARAQAFEVPHDDSIGAERSTAGKDEAEPAPPVAPPDDGVAQRSVWADRWLVTPAVGSLAILLALAVSVAFAGFSKSVPPPIAEQVREIKRDATRGNPDTARDDRHTVKSEKVDLQGGGASSYVFAFQDAPDQDAFFRRLFRGKDPRQPASDELRVYDVEKGRLRERFRFQPDGRGKKAAIFGRRAVGDVDKDAADELIGGYGIPGDGTSQAQVPFALDWDDAKEQYRMVPLALEPPALPRPQALDPGLKPVLDAYSHPIRFRDSETGRELSGLRAQDFAIDAKPEFRLLAGYLVELPNERHGGILRLEPYQFRTGAPLVSRCEISKKPVTTVIPKGGSRESALLRKWEAISKSRKCVPP